MPTSRPETSDSHCQPPFAGDISVESFLQDYWQKQPLLLRNAFPGIQSPLTPNELAGLACEDDVNARIVFEKHQKGHWYVLHGPLNEDDFSDLPDRDWTLLVTDVEKHVPEARALIDRFRFIPDWRIDDLMISYAPEGGSVGPHTDAYDVFLIQAQGQRRWMINPDYDEACLDGTELRILEHFSAAQEWVLNPGDMLYLPPNVAHYGIALNACITCSVGFRAPSISSMVSEYAENIAADIDPELRYRDPGLARQQSPAEITTESLAALKAGISTQLTIDDDRFLRWFGEFSSEQRAGILLQPPASPLSSYEELLAALHSGCALMQSPAVKFLYAGSHGAALLFVDGASYNTSLAFAGTLANNREITEQMLLDAVQHETDRQTLFTLYQHGSLLLR